MEAMHHPGQTNEQLLAAYARTGDERLRTEIIERHRNLIRSLARKFVRTGVSVEDLVQAAWIGLIGAVDRFDPAHSAQFNTYAVQCAVGEIKRYFRDKTWAVKVPRQMADLSAQLPATEERLCRMLQRSPSVAEMAEALQVSDEDLLRAMEVARAYCPAGLDNPYTGLDGTDSLSLSETVGSRDERIERVTDRAELDLALASLDDRLRRILYLRFTMGSTQDEVGEELGVSQMHVSRLERKALALMRSAMVPA